MSERPAETAYASAPVTGDDAVLVRRYVGSLYALAEKDNSVDTVAAELRGLRRLWDESPEWRFIARDPRIAAAAVAAAVAQVIKLAGVGKLVGQFVSAVAENGRLSIMPMLIEGFIDEVARRHGERRADIRTAQALSATQRDAIGAVLSQVVGGKIRMNVVEDKTILGGMTIQLGCQFIDASLKNRLDTLERKLKKTASVA